MREGAVKQLRSLGWDVTVVMPNYDSNKLIESDEIICIPFQHFQNLSLLWERLGINEDYLDSWVSSALKLLKNRMSRNDIVFASTGGELGTVKLASLLKKYSGCKLVVNYRDPMQAATYWELKIDKKFHVNRDKAEKKYISEADLILTSSATFNDALSEKYPSLKAKITNNYFGFLTLSNDISLNKEVSETLKIVYAGRMGNLQKPEILMEAVNFSKNREKVEIFYIGDYQKYKPLKKKSNVYMIEYMEHQQFSEFLLRKADVGFVSLAEEYLGFCLPSKIYEYINLALPVLAALPEGDAANIIKNRGYGYACHYADLECLGKAIDNFFEHGNLQNIRDNLLRDREEWSMSRRIIEVDSLLKSII